jgi:pimeloyl-ACP methyl ester carboxylesterase
VLKINKWIKGEMGVKRTYLLVSLFISVLPLKAYELQKVLLQVPKHAESNEMLTRDAELLTRENAKGTVILYHGFKGHKDSIRVMRTLFPDYNTLIFDFRAHGNKTEGQCCSFGLHERLDVKASVDFVKNHPQLKDLPVIAYAISMGAVSALEAQAQYGDLFDGMILDSPFDSVEAVVSRGLDNITFKLAGYDLATPLRSFFKKYSFDNRVDKALRFALNQFAGYNASTTPTCLKPVSPHQSIEKVTIPTLLISCAHDTQVPLSAVQQIHNNSSGSTQLWVADGRGHVDAFFYNPEQYLDRVNTFLKGVHHGSFDFQNVRVALGDSDKS